MMTTQELVKWLLMVAANDAAHEYTNRADHMRLAADRLSEMEAQLKRLRKHLSEMTVDIACYEDVSVIRANAMKRSKE